MRASAWFGTVATALLAAGVAACMQIGTGTGPGGTAGDAGAVAIDGGGDGGPQGSGCVQDPSGTATLCQQIDTCPGLVVDPGAFPDCGFRIHEGYVLDLECLCGDALCPVGVRSTCAQAAQLLAQQNELFVCQQQSERGCVQLSGAGASSGSGGGSGASGGSGGGSGGGTCDKQCESTCAGDPSCMQLCGC